LFKKLKKPTSLSLRSRLALEAFVAPKELLVRRPTPPGIQEFFLKKQYRKSAEAHTYTEVDY
jgi:hypothetical protein